MTYGIRQLKNRKLTGVLKFNTGKRVFLNADELKEFKFKIIEWQQHAIEKYTERNDNEP